MLRVVNGISVFEVDRPEENRPESWLDFQPIGYASIANGLRKKEITNIIRIIYRDRWLVYVIISGSNLKGKFYVGISIWEMICHLYLNSETKALGWKMNGF